MMKIILISAVFCIFSTTQARAEGYIGAVLGPSFLNDGLGTKFAGGGHIGFKLSPFIGIGAYATSESLGTASAGLGSISASGSSTETILAGELNIYPAGDFFFFGGKVGTGINSNTTNVTLGGVSTGTSTSTSGLAIGPAAGLNFKLGRVFSLGAEVSYIMVSQSGSSSLNMTNVFGTATFWWGAGR